MDLSLESTSIDIRHMSVTLTFVISCRFGNWGSCTSSHGGRGHVMVCHGNVISKLLLCCIEIGDSLVPHLHMLTLP